MLAGHSNSMKNRRGTKEKEARCQWVAGNQIILFWGGGGGWGEDVCIGREVGGKTASWRRIRNLGQKLLK